MSAATFQQELDRLRKGADEPSTREIARRTAGLVSHTTVADTLRGNKVPPWNTAKRIIVALGGDPEQLMEQWRAARREKAPTRPGAAPARELAVDVVALTEALRGIAGNLNDYVERRAADLAEPRIEAAELECDREMAEVLARETLRQKRDKELIAELRRQITALERHGEKMQRLNRHLMTLEPEEAGRLRAVLNGTQTGRS